MAQDKDLKTPNVPPLRFPGFTDEWEKTSLGEIGETLIGLTYSPKDVVENGGTIVFRSSNIQNGMIDYSDLVRVNKSIKERIITKENDILVCARNGSTRLIGKNTLLKKSDSGNTFGAFMMIYRSEDNDIVHPILSTRRYFSQVSENLGARINQITTSDLNSFEFNLPNNPEEKRKIGKLFQLINERIATQNKIIDNLKSLIKGLAKELTTVGTPNMCIKDCTECHSSALQENCVQDYGNFPVYGASGVAGYTNDYQNDGEAILIIKDGSGVGTLTYVNDRFSIIGTLNYLTTKPQISLKYLYFCLMSFNFETYKTGMAIPHIYFKDYGSAKIWCPPIDEQEKIAITLSAIENKFNVESILLQSLISKKQYLLSQLFI
ncbi:restriction endonuclease subunit S [Bacteroidales bacterium]|nr:restriction endonuclease subunit S [Bacteroidales bacterium]